MESRANTVRGVSLRELLPESQLLGADDIRVHSCTSDSRSAGPVICLSRWLVRRGMVMILPRTPLLAGHRRCSRIGLFPVLACRPALSRIRPPRMGCCVRPWLIIRRAGCVSSGSLARMAKRPPRILLPAFCRPQAVAWVCWARLVIATAKLSHLPIIQRRRRRRLASWLARMEANGCSHAVLEVSSHSLAQQRLAGVDVDVACLTNVRHDHFDYHGTQRRYIAAKSRLLDLLVPEGVAIVNGDDAGSSACAARYDGPLVSVGIESPAEITATLLVAMSQRADVLARYGE